MKRNKEKKPKFEDDGRTIANMNVEGMPWYNPVRDKEKSSISNDFEGLSRKEKRAMMGGIMAAALLIGAIFIIGAFLFVLFCTKVWFV